METLLKIIYMDQNNFVKLLGDSQIKITYMIKMILQYFWVIHTHGSRNPKLRIPTLVAE